MVRLVPTCERGYLAELVTILVISALLIFTALGPRLSPDDEPAEVYAAGPHE